MRTMRSDAHPVSRSSSIPQATPPSRPSWGFRIHPVEWIRVARRLADDPWDTEQGARMFFAAGGHDEEPTHRRFRRTPEGRRMLAERTPYPALFRDCAALRALPAGTLGREYVRQLDERGIDPVELARLTEAAYEGHRFTPEHAYVRDRVREAHDLVHTLSGYGIDVLGEAGVLAFTYGQTGNKGWAVLVLLNHLSTLVRGRIDGWALAWHAWRRGRRARFLAAVDDWDRLLRLPIDEARSELGLASPRPYRVMSLETLFGRPRPVA